MTSNPRLTNELNSRTEWNLDGISIQDLLSEMNNRKVDSINWSEGESRNAEDHASAKTASGWIEEYNMCIEQARAFGQDPKAALWLRQVAAKAMRKALRIRGGIAKRWTVPNSLKESRRSSFELYKKSEYRDNVERCPLSIDHTRTWQQNGKLVCVTTDPYDLRRVHLEAIAALCEERDLAAYVHYGSEVHVPGECFSIVSVKAGDEEKLPTLKAAITSRS